MKKIAEKPKERKLLLCMPFSPHEIPQARELAKLWADLEDGFNSVITVAFISRYDIEPSAIGKDVIEHVKKKFNVMLHRCQLKGKGWPRGCNQLEVGAYQWFVESNRGGQIDFEYMLLAEPDTTPLRRGWAVEIMNEAYDNQALILGAYFVKEDGCAHINGNCVMHRDFWKRCKTIWTIDPRVGWDVAIGKCALSIGTPSRLIWQDYRLGMADNPWKGPDYLFAAKSFRTKSNPLSGQILRPAMVHGTKTMDAINAVRKKYF